MPYNGAGAFALYTPGNPVVTGTTISSTWAQNTLSDIATGLSTAITKNGQTVVTANIPMGGFIFTGLGATQLDNIDFTQAGAGAVVRSAQDKAREVITSADYNNTRGTSNVWVAIDTSPSVTTAVCVVAMGEGAGSAITSGSNDTLIGVEAGHSLTTGSSCTFTGQAAGRLAIVSTNCCYYGDQAGASATGNSNTILGASGGPVLSTGGADLFAGFQAGLVATTATQCVLLGASSGSILTTGNNVICIGYNAQPTLATTSNEAVLGNDNIVLTRLKGAVQMAFKPFVQAVAVVADNTNVTGDGTTATIVFGSEIFDQAGNFTANTFTCNAAGIYSLRANVRLEGIEVAQTVGVINFVVNGVARTVFEGNVGAMRDANNILQLCVTDTFSIAATQTATLTVRCINGTKVTDVGGWWTIEMVA